MLSDRHRPDDRCGKHSCAAPEIVSWFGHPLKKRYIDGLFGQVHLLENADLATAREPPLLCLHATAYSGQSFTPLLQAFDDERKLIALDTPGYGASDPPPTPIGIDGYADALIDSVMRLVDGQVDVLGYHTGVYIATEAANRRPDLFRRLVLLGVPFFHDDDRAAWEKRLAKPHFMTERLSQFEERWMYFVTQRSPHVTLDRAFKNFIDELKAYPRASWAHRALFDYDDRARLPIVTTPSLIINFPGHLATGSRRAAELMQAARIVEEELDLPVLDAAADRLKQIIDDYLEGA